MAAVLDRHIPNWRQDPYALRNALDIPRKEIWQAHQAAKQQHVNKASNAYTTKRR